MNNNRKPSRTQSKLAYVTRQYVLCMGSAIILAIAIPPMLLGMLEPPFDKLAMVSFQLLFLALGLCVSVNRAQQYIRQYQKNLQNAQLEESLMFAKALSEITEKERAEMRERCEPHVVGSNE